MGVDACEPHLGGLWRGLVDFVVFEPSGHGGDVGRSGAAAATKNVDEALVEKVLDLGGHDLG